MAIGKAVVFFVCGMIAAVVLLTMFSMAAHDKSTDAYYNDTINNTAATAAVLGSRVTTTGAGMMQPLVLLGAIFVVAAVIMIFGKKL